MAGETYFFRGATCQWGTINESVAGTVVDENIKTSPSKDEVPNKDGARVGIIYFDKTYSGSISVVVAQNAQFPDQGDPITLTRGDGQAFVLFVDDVEDKGTHKGKRMLTITLDGGEHIEYTASQETQQDTQGS